MQRKYWVGLGLLAGLAGAVIIGRKPALATVQRLAGQEAAPVAKQWEFDSAEKAALMQGVVQQQRELVAQTTTPEEHERAAKFARYYEGRVAALHPAVTT